MAAVFGLLDYLHDPLYSPARCPIVGHGLVDSRKTDHRRCPSEELWIDTATGLMLRSRVNGHDLLLVQSIQYHPRPPGRPPQVRPARRQPQPVQARGQPVLQHQLAPGKAAPNWHATTLAGGRLQVTDLRGKPALVLLLPDRCTDPVCNELAALEDAYRHSNGATVDTFGGTAQGTKKLTRLNHVTLPIVIDHKEASHKAWAFHGYPHFLLLDSRSHVIKAHFHQSVAQLTRMLAERHAPR